LYKALFLYAQVNLSVLTHSEMPKLCLYCRSAILSCDKSLSLSIGEIDQMLLIFLCFATELNLSQKC